MKVLIIEDEAPAFRRLQKILEDLDRDIEIIDVIDSVAESIKWFNNHHMPDLIFMDIQLSDGISFEIFDQVTITKPVIFTTAFDEYTLKAFKVNSIDYLLKPIKQEELERSFQKYEVLTSVKPSAPAIDLNTLVKQIRIGEPTYKSRFLVKQGDKLISVETAAIAYFMLRTGVVHLVTVQNKHYLMDQSLDDLVSQLDPTKFYRANRQFIIQFSAIAAVHRYHRGKLLVELQPKADDEVIVSAEKASEFKRWLGD